MSTRLRSPLTYPDGTQQQTAYTPSAVRDTALTGLSTATATAVVATDSVLAASGKLQAQITATNTAVAAKANTTDLTAHTTNTSNPHSTTKAQVGLGNVDNTSDLAKPVSTATQTALDAKENAIALGTGSQFFAGNKTWRDLATDVRATVLTGLSTATNAVITATDTVLSAAGKLQKQITDHIANVSNPHSVTKAQVGLANVDNTSDASKPISTATQTAINAKENLLGSGTTSQYLRGDKTFQTLDKNAVGLANVDNTSDASKPISTATQTALNAKANNASPTFTGTVTAADLAYTGTLTGGTGAINIGSGQIVKDASGKVGIGTSTPSRLLEIADTSGLAAQVGIKAANTGYSEIYFADTDSDRAGAISYDHSANSLGSYVNGAERTRIDANGNVGIGVVPSAWASVSGSPALQIGNTGASLFGGGTGWSASNWVYLGNNAYYADANWRYSRTNPAAQYIQQNGQHQWLTAPSGTAGDTIPFTQTMTLNASGNLGLGATPSAWGTAGNAKAIQLPATAVYSFSDSKGELLTNAFYDGTNYIYRVNYPAVAYSQEANSGTHKWLTAPSGTAGDTIPFRQAMTLDANGNVLVGRTDLPATTWSSASTRVAAKGNATNHAAEFIAESNDGLKRISLFASGTSNDAGLFIPSGTTNLVLGTNGTERARIDSNGNMGIGVTPSLWAGSASRGLEVGAFASLSSSNTYGTGLGFNVWHNGTNYIRRGANVVSFLQCDGSFRFRYAATGAAGSTVTFSDAMLINTSGNVGIGTTSPSQRLHVNGTVQQTGAVLATTTKTANYTANGNDYVIRCDPTTAAITITLPAAASNTGRHYVIKRTTAGANAVTIDANASELIDGALTQTLTTQYQTLRICSNGTGWDII